MAPQKASLTSKYSSWNTSKHCNMPQTKGTTRYVHFLSMNNFVTNWKYSFAETKVKGPAFQGIHTVTWIMSSEKERKTSQQSSMLKSLMNLFKFSNPLIEESLNFDKIFQSLDWRASRLYFLISQLKRLSTKFFHLSIEDSLDFVFQPLDWRVF